MCDIVKKQNKATGETARQPPAAHAQDPGSLPAPALGVTATSPTPGPLWTLHKYGTHMDMRINESESLFKNKTMEKVTLTFLKINPLKPLLKFFCEIQVLQFKFSLPNKS